MMRGGFAAALTAGPEQGPVPLRELLRDVVYRDIVSRHSLRSARPLMTLALHLIASFKQRVTSPPKYYAVDTGLAGANSPNATPDLGRKLENAVLLALRRRGAAPVFAAAPHAWECDFVTPDHAIQCCARLTPENRRRELRGLVAAAGLPGGVRGGRELLVITLDQEDALQEEGRSIRVIPAWKWLD